MLANLVGHFETPLGNSFFQIRPGGLQDFLMTVAQCFVDCFLESFVEVLRYEIKRVIFHVQTDRHRIEVQVIFAIVIDQLELELRFRLYVIRGHGNRPVSGDRHQDPNIDLIIRRQLDFVELHVDIYCSVREVQVEKVYTIARKSVKSDVRTNRFEVVHVRDLHLIDRQRIRRRNVQFWDSILQFLTQSLYAIDHALVEFRILSSAHLNVRC